MASANPTTGQKAPQSGIYKPTQGGGKEIAVSKGDTLPPSNGQGTGWKLVRPTK
jgi:YjzC-like protein